MCDDWLLFAAEVLDVPASELERIDANTVVRKGVVVSIKAPPTSFPLDVRVEALNAEAIAKDMPWMCWTFGTSGFSIAALPDGDAPRPGTPLCEHVKEIATRLKEIEADRKRDIQAAESPSEEKE